MTPDEFTQIVNAIDTAISARMEQVYGELEAVKQEVREAVEAVSATAQVLHDNDTAIMGRLMQRDGSAPAEFMEQAADSWRRFIEQEARALGIKTMVAKS